MQHFSLKIQSKPPDTPNMRLLQQLCIYCQHHFLGAIMLQPCMSSSHNKQQPEGMTQEQMSILVTSGDPTVPEESPVSYLSWISDELFFQRGASVNEGCTTYIIPGSLY